MFLRQYHIWRVYMLLSQIDINNLVLIRENVIELINKSTLLIRPSSKILDVAPDEHNKAKMLFHKDFLYHTLALESKYNPTYIGDITKYNSSISDNFYDVIFFLEVIEHVNNPFDAITEIYRILKPHGLLVLSTPFNLRIHGPLPDNYRFTEHGLRHLLREFTNIEIMSLEDPDRPLMPIHYTVIARK